MLIRHLELKASKDGGGLCRVPFGNLALSVVFGD